MANRQTGADRRSSILQAALDLFSTHGYDGTTTKAIAQQIGVTEALLFKHFRSKQELLQGVVETYLPRRFFSPPPAELHALSARESLAGFLT